MIELHVSVLVAYVAAIVLLSLAFTLMLGLWLGRGKIIDRQGDRIESLLSELEELRPLRELRRQEARRHIHKIGGRS